jgi:hypothetical protein
MNTVAKVKPEKKERERMYYADWLRAISIHFVIMVHCDQINIEACDVFNRDKWPLDLYPFEDEMIEKARGFIKSLV